jgi:uncharacterized protein YkwD
VAARDVYSLAAMISPRWCAIPLAFFLACSDGTSSTDSSSDDSNSDDSNSDDSNSDDSSSDDSSDSTDLSADEQGVLAEINRQRTMRGLSTVALRDDLVCAAKDHSADIGERQECTHDSANGDDPGDRVDACGGDGWSGEIVACGHGTPVDAVQGWIDSPGHNAIMFDPDQKKVGVAMHNNYWTAIFDKSE